MSYANMEEDEIDGEIIVLGRNDGGQHFKWFGDTVNPMEIKKEIIPTLEEHMEILDILVRDNHINEGEYKRKTDTLKTVWQAEKELKREGYIEVVEMVMNGETVYLNERNGIVYNYDEETIGIATRLNRNSWSIFNSSDSGRSPDILTYS